MDRSNLIDAAYEVSTSLADLDHAFPPGDGSPVASIRNSLRSALSRLQRETGTEDGDYRFPVLVDQARRDADNGIPNIQFCLERDLGPEYGRRIFDAAFSVR